MLTFELLIDSTEMKQEETLETADYNDEQDEDVNVEEFAEVPDNIIEDEIYPYKKACEIVQVANNHTFSAVNCRYRILPSPFTLVKHGQQLRRIRKYVNTHGTRKQKLQQIDELVFSEFVQAREKCLPIHDNDLKRTAIRKAKDVNVTGFTASKHRISNFKRRFHIICRKVTKLVTQHHESTGKFDPRVLKTIYQAPNIHVTCRKSGKLTKSHIEYWARNVLRPSLKQKCSLLVDSWLEQTDDESYEKAFTDQITCERMDIPLKITADIQPRYKYLFRQWKYLRQKCFDRVMIDQLPIDMRSRNNTLKMHSLIHNQLASRRFWPMVQYAWYICGYRSEDPGKFENIQE
ncbi:unnamed protein product, partial [Didymodactylos carnosus]